MITDEDMVLATGIMLSTSGKRSEAIQYFEEQTREHQDWSHIRWALLRLIKHDHPEQALPLFAELAGLYPDVSQLYVDWGSTFESLGRSDDAIAVYRKYLEHHPSCFDVIIKLDPLLPDDESISVYENGRSGNEDNVLFLVSFAYKLSWSQRWEAAITIWQEVLSKIPDRIPFHDIGPYWIGEAYHLHSNAHYYLGEARIGMKQFDTAVDELQKSVARNPDSIRSWYLLGTTLETSGRLIEAIDAYQNVLRIFNRGYEIGDTPLYWVDACKGIGRILEHMDKQEEAIPYFEQARRIYPEDHR